MTPESAPQDPIEPGSSEAGRRRSGTRLFLVAGVALAATFLVVWLGVLRETDLELSLETIGRARDWIQGLGWLGPVAFVTIVALRPFLLVSSHAVLTLGGLAFGPWSGTLWGAVGLVISAAYQFGAARLLGDAWVRPQLGRRGLAAERRMQRAGPLLVGLVTAHPLGTMTPVHLAAGLVSMPVLGFGAAVVLAAPVRAGIYSVLGASVLEWDPATSLALAGGLGVLTLAPLLSARARRWILTADDSTTGRPRS